MLLGERGVEVAGGLVGQQDGGVVDQRARDGHALLLAAGEPARQRVRLVRQAHLLEQLAGALADVGVGAPSTSSAKATFSRTVRCGEQLEVLEDTPMLRRR